MGRTPVSFRPALGDAGGMDRFAQECFSGDPQPSRTASLGAVGNESLSPESEKQAVNQTENQTAEVTPQHLWFELSVSERQRFGQCFSLMVLKALGLRQAPFTEE